MFTIPRGSTDSEHLQPAVAYWTFRYWGFARERVKMLNGGDDAWDVAGQPLTDARAGDPFDLQRREQQGAEGHAAHLGRRDAHVVDRINRDQSLRNTWQILDVRGFTATPYLANA